MLTILIFVFFAAILYGAIIYAQMVLVLGGLAIAAVVFAIRKRREIKSVLLKAKKRIPMWWKYMSKKDRIKFYIAITATVAFIIAMFV